MKRVPFSYNTFVTTQKKAYTKADREKTTVSTVIHHFLLEYTKDEPDVELENAAAPQSTAANQAPQAPQTEASPVAIEAAVQPENITSSEPVEAVHTEINSNTEPLAEEKTPAPVKKASPTVKPTKKPSTATVKKSPPKKELKKVTPKPGIAAKKKPQAGKSNKAKPKSKS